MEKSRVSCRVSTRNIVAGTSQQEGMRVTIVNTTPVTTSDICRELSLSTTLTEGDVTAVVVSLRRVIVKSLQQGLPVSLDGIGTLSLAVGTVEPMYAGEAVHGDDVCVKGINFRPSEELLKECRDVHFSCKQQTPAPLDDQQLLASLRDYMRDEANGGLITARRLASLAHCSISYTNHRLKTLLADGRLRHAAHAPHCYEPGERLFS